MKSRAFMLAAFAAAVVTGFLAAARAEAVPTGTCYRCFHCDVPFNPDFDECCAWGTECGAAGNTRCHDKYPNRYLGSKSCAIAPDQSCILGGADCQITHYGPGPIGIVDDSGNGETDVCVGDGGWCPASCSYCLG